MFPSLSTVPPFGSAVTFPSPASTVPPAGTVMLPALSAVTFPPDGAVAVVFPLTILSASTFSSLSTVPPFGSVSSFPFPVPTFPPAGTVILPQKEDVLVPILFYQYIGERDSDFLAAHHYSKEGVLDGMKRLAERQGYGHITSLLMEN